MNYKNYYNHCLSQSCSTALTRALKLLQFEKTDRAVDLGSGVGNDAIELLKRGFHVTLVEQNEIAQDFFLKNLHRNKINFLRAFTSYFQKPFTEIVEKNFFEHQVFNLINASYSLPFLKVTHLTELLKYMTTKLVKGGVFVAQFFTENHIFVHKKKLDPYNVSQIIKLFGDYSSVSVKSVSEEKVLYNLESITWTSYEVIAIK